MDKHPKEDSHENHTAGHSANGVQNRFRGYDKEEVNRFLEEIAETVEELNRENAVQRENHVFGAAVDRIKADRGDPVEHARVCAVAHEDVNAARNGSRARHQRS